MKQNILFRETKNIIDEYLTLTSIREPISKQYMCYECDFYYVFNSHLKLHDKMAKRFDTEHCFDAFIRVIALII